MKRPRGTGSVYRRPGSQNWCLQYYHNGVMHKESSGTTNERQAQKLLAQRLGEIATNNFIEPSNRKITIDELYECYLNNYRMNGKASLEGAEQRWQSPAKDGQPAPPPGRLKKAFGGMKALALTTDKLEKYAVKCQIDGLSNGTINRDFSALRRAFKLAFKARKLSIVPHFPMLDEASPRQGFLEYEDYLKLCQHATELWLRTLLAVAYHTGMRRGELVGQARKGYQDGLRVYHVDLKTRKIRLGKTKNGDYRVAPMVQEVFVMLAACVAGKAKNDFVFTRDNGEQVRDFRDRWDRLFKDAGVDRKLVHDNRRSAARNMRRAGVDEGTIMKAGGWKTRSVFDRYDIHDERDLTDSEAKLDAAKQLWAAQLQQQPQFDTSLPDLHQNRAAVEIQNLDVKPLKSVN